MLEKLVSILFAVVTLFAACTRNLADSAWIGLFVVDLCLLAAWCAFTFFEFAKEWRLVSPGGYILMIVTLVIMFFQIRYNTTAGLVAFLADVAATAFLITVIVMQARRRSY